jgi:hypothetical protein
VRRLDQDQAGWIEAERAQPMTVKAAMGAVWAKPEGRYDEDERMRPRQARENCGDEPESSRHGCFCRRDDLVQGAAGKAARRQMGIKPGKAEG